MSVSEQLYQEYLQRRASKRQNSIHRQIQQRKEDITRKVLQLREVGELSPQSCIELLRQIGVIERLQSAESIMEIMRLKREDRGQWEDEQAVNECRLIYFLWSVFEQEEITCCDLKHILLVLSDASVDRGVLLKEVWGEREGIEELIEAWDVVLAHERRSDGISDISIIKSKNEGSIGDNKNDNKENQPYLANSMLRTNRSQEKKRHPSEHPLEKSYQRKSKPHLERSNSNAKMTAKRSHLQSSASSSQYSHGRQPSINFFSAADNLSRVEEKQLVNRLYDCEKYKYREELKAQIEQERIKVELENCTFKPQIVNKSRAMSKSKVAGQTMIKGYEKAVERMKAGYQKNKELKENLEYRIWREGDRKAPTGQPPRFLSRVKSEPEKALFTINFTIGRQNIRIKIRESDRISEIIERMGLIYSLKEDVKAYVRCILEQELNRYYEEQVLREREGSQQNN